MTVKDLVKEELLRVREDLSQKSEAELRKLDKNMLKIKYKIFDKEHDLVAWSEEDPDGALAVIIEMRKKQFLGSVLCFQEGFRLRNGIVKVLTEQQLWEYD